MKEYHPGKIGGAVPHCDVIWKNQQAVKWGKTGFRVQGLKIRV
jgi:hypothetical protein